MAKPSSAKKVARVAARSGGAKSANKQRNWLFPAAIVAIVVLGLGVLVYARSNSQAVTGNKTPPRAHLSDTQPYDHWHAAFDISVCGKELPPLTDPTADDPLGIHTHGDGLIHIHPFVTRAAGKLATMSRFWSHENLQVTNAGFKTPDGKVYEVGKTTCNGKPAVLRLAKWDEALQAAAGAKPTEIVTSNFGATRFTRDYMAFTLAFGPKGDTIKPPKTSAKLKELGACDGPQGASLPACQSASQPPAVTVPATIPPTTKGASGK
ncbi:MAG: hypothetical protein JWM05_719 [Acidimicrobiales bacterium]|nr:hypothetical protein [Acidimicrobiales bacterium]